MSWLGHAWVGEDGVNSYQHSTDSQNKIQLQNKSRLCYYMTVTFCSHGIRFGFSHSLKIEALSCMWDPIDR